MAELGGVDDEGVRVAIEGFFGCSKRFITNAAFALGSGFVSGEFCLALSSVRAVAFAFRRGVAQNGRRVGKNYTLPTGGTAAGTAFVDVPTGNNGQMFDTGITPLSNGVAANYRILGIQITLRVYDPGTGLSRQATLIEDM